MTATTMELDWDAAEGSEAAKEASKNSGAAFDRVEFFGLDASPGGVASGADKALVRFLSDHVKVEGQADLIPWITVEQHSMVPTKPRPADLKENSGWPAKMTAVCRNGKIFKARYGDCYICNNMTKPDGKKYFAGARTWAIGVLREQVRGDGSEALGGPGLKGQIVGVRDMTKEVAVLGEDNKPTGETKMVKQYVKFNLGWKNFFGPLSGIAGYHGTVVDRDYLIQRSGMGQNDTNYTFVPMDPIQMGDGRVFDVRNPEIRAEHYGDRPDLRQIVAEVASDEFYDRFYRPTNGSAPVQAAPVQSVAGQSQIALPTTTPAAPGGAPNGDRLAALRDRITAAPAAEAPAPAAAAPQNAAPAAAQPAFPAGGLAL